MSLTQQKIEMNRLEKYMVMNFNLMTYMGVSMGKEIVKFSIN